MSNSIERTIVRRLVDDFLANGAVLGVNDGEEITLARSADANAVMKALFTTDEDYLLVWANGDHFNPNATGWVRLVYGNDGEDVVCDYTTNLEPMMAPINAWVERTFA